MHEISKYEIRNFTAGYSSRTEVLHDASLKMKAGTITTLIGPNGCGKSTLLKSILGLVPYRTGEFLIDGKNANEFSRAERTQKTAYLSQGKNVPDISVSKMVLHGRFSYLKYPRRYRKEDTDIAKSAMEKMGISEYADKNMRTLSGGLRQKVYLAMALCQNADFIMLDEPSTYLDIYEQIKLQGILKDIAASGKTILMVSHNIAEALKYSDQIAVMKSGSIVKTGTPDEVLKSGAISDVFHVDVTPVEKDGKTEYFYEIGEEIH